ncbi:hypothetical protein [Arthrobacter sp. SD76]|uniref:hypothetical protein n=1 Tax=Arthrobacter sp. SD76 TaxID=3415007 RepID=UPI003C716CF2
MRAQLVPGFVVAVLVDFPPLDDLVRFVGRDPEPAVVDRPGAAHHVDQVQLRAAHAQRVVKPPRAQLAGRVSYSQVDLLADLHVVPGAVLQGRVDDFQRLGEDQGTAAPRPHRERVRRP